MMNAQPLNGRLIDLPMGTTRRLDDDFGELEVVAGRIWLTRSGDLADHDLGPGSRVRIAPYEHAVVEALGGVERATLRWYPQPGALAWVQEAVERVAGAASPAPAHERPGGRATRQAWAESARLSHLDAARFGNERTTARP